MTLLGQAGDNESYFTQFAPFSGLQTVKVCGEVYPAMIRAGHAEKNYYFSPSSAKKTKTKKNFKCFFFFFFKLSAIHPSANAWQRLNLALLSLA